MPGNKAIIDAVARVVADPVDLVIHHTIENCTNWVPTSESTWPEAINKKGAIQRLELTGAKKLFFIACIIKPIYDAFCGFHALFTPLRF